MINAYAAHEPGGMLVPFTYEPGPLDSDAVDIEVESCGICHSDLSMLDNDWRITEYPFVPGHEVIGIIRAVGDNVNHLHRGNRVGLGWHAGYCMTCPACQSGDHNLCAEAEGTIISHHGGFADRVRARAASVVPLPEGIAAASAGPLFCGGITVFNPLLQFDVKPTQRVGVIGIGGLGHLALQFLKAWGCEVTAFTSSADKAAEALKMGATATIASGDPAALKAASGYFDLLLSTVNVKLDWNAYIATLRPKGRLHFVGATLDSLDIGVFPLIVGQRSLSGSPVGSPASIAKMLEFCARHGIEPRTESYPFKQVNEAIARLRSGQARYRVVLQH